MVEEVVAEVVSFFEHLNEFIFIFIVLTFSVCTNGFVTGPGMN